MGIRKETRSGFILCSRTFRRRTTASYRCLQSICCRKLLIGHPSTNASCLPTSRSPTTSLWCSSSCPSHANDGCSSHGCSSNGSSSHANDGCPSHGCSSYANDGSSSHSSTNASRLPTSRFPTTSIRCPSYANATTNGILLNRSGLCQELSTLTYL